MPRHPKPWYRKGRGWFIQRNGKQVFLGKKKPDAMSAYHWEMGRAPRAVQRTDSVAQLVDAFLEWVQQNQAPDTYRWYLDRLQEFCCLYPDLRVSALQVYHVQQWLDSRKVSRGTKRNLARSIMRCMKWAEEQGYIDKSPIAHFRKPRGGVRQTVITPEAYHELLASIRRQPLRDLVMFAWETGARAAECMSLEARHVELMNSRVVFPVEEEKMERAPRVIYLTGVALEIVARLVKVHPTGPLFRNTNGAWNAGSINCAFNALQIRMGKKALKAEGFTLDEADIEEKIKTLKPSFAKRPKTAEELREEARKKLWSAAAVRRAPKYCMTALRHSFCHRLLKAGVDALTVSSLMGHASVSMVVEYYSHMNHAPDYLRQSLERAS
jgi:integrase